ncbi:DUF4421 family protein [Capnocytophaga catalasegens]|uniref:DUF4421 domain-containing protein n=1 Tax=Capnocytophaga catalasegens TaxID=1004260 RepID=A0AAV5B131_9FLAO|nr:DUF4421 family protein [Capnocytophaga catalasegens]GIZ14355.1 hypothetical protein RCZ03_03560 [Capnocytophaga catalasegens]GJM51352.1 hypothetical protein RCZ15_23250 [Capnocytophaga catalasegens]GJM53231.1 hypothetical protein RCZ16_15480 [Capnocytophaga catalasegens]
MKKLIVLLGGILSWGLSAQEKQEETTNFVTYSDKITTSFTYFDSSNSYFLNYTENGQPQNMSFRPNTQKQLIAGIDYKIITASIGFTPAFMKVNREVQKSKQFNLRFQINYKKWFQTLSYAYHKGYFIDFNQMEVYAPNLRTLKMGGVTSFVLNDRFSYKSLLSYNQ